MKTVNGPNEPFKYKNGDRVKWKENYFGEATNSCTGTVVGVSSTSVAVIGASFIVKPDRQIGEYECVGIFEVALELL